MFCLWEASEDKLHHLIMEKHYIPNQTLYHSVLRNNSNRTQWEKGVAACPHIPCLLHVLLLEVHFMVIQIKYISTPTKFWFI
jgi:pentose-5-phosphate-3-epimerase